MSLFMICALAALAVVAIVAAIQIRLEERRERQHIRVRCCCREYLLTEDQPTVTGYDVIHELWRCSPRREEVR